MYTDDITQVKKEMIKAAKLLADKGLLYHGGHANLSTRIDKDRMVMTRGGDISHLDMDSFAIVDLAGTVIDGEMGSASAEVILMHTALYREKASVGAIIHTHSPNVTAFAVAGQPIPIAYEPLLRFGITEPIPVVPWAPRGSEESVNGILNIVKKSPELPAVILANHGLLAFSSNPKKTADLIFTLDEAAELIIKARQIGGEKELPDVAFK